MTVESAQGEELDSFILRAIRHIIGQLDHGTRWNAPSRPRWPQTPLKDAFLATQRAAQQEAEGNTQAASAWVAAGQPAAS